MSRTHAASANGRLSCLDFDALTGEAAADVEIWQVTDAGFASIAVLPQSL